MSQWAKHLGATVIGTVGSDDKVAVAKRARLRSRFPLRRFRRAGARSHRRPGRAGGLRLGRQGDVRELAEIASRRAASSPRSANPPAIRRLVSVRELGNMGSLFVTHPSLIHYTETRAELLETVNDLFAMVAERQDQDRDQPRISAARRRAGAPRCRGAQDHRLGGADPLRRRAEWRNRPGNNSAPLLKPGAALLLPGVANALAARVVADCGFTAAYVTGAGIANSYPRHSRQRPGHAQRAGRPRHRDPRSVFRPADGRRRHRLRQRAEHAAHHPGAGARRRRRDPDRGPGVPEALRPFRGQGGHPRGRDGRKDQGRGRRPQPIPTC